MKDLLVRDILNITKGKLICGDINTKCEEFSKDTRTLNKGDVYLGIKGENFNGSDFYKEALEKGAKGCILEDIQIDEEELKNYKDKFIIIVDNTVEALQKIASYKRSLYDIRVIGITGSVGKTSTKDLISSVLSTEYKVLKTEGNYNNEIGLPLTILKLKDHECLVLEMGMSELGEISVLSKIAKPDTAVITTIGSSHIGQLGSRENILKAKLEILEGLDKNGTLIINIDNDLLNSWNKDNNDTHKHITYGIENISDLNAYSVDIKENKSTFKIKYNNEEYTVTVPVSGKHFIYNSLAAICVGLNYNIKPENIIKGISNFNLTKNRMEIIKHNNYTIINDCYNASLESISFAIEYMSTLSGRKIAVLGDVLELGCHSKQIHESIGGFVSKSELDILITVGKEMKYAADIVSSTNKNINVFSYSNNQEAINKLQETIKEKDIILIKASNSMNFKEIVDALL